MIENKKNYYVIVIAILLIMLILNVLSFFKKDSAWNLETIKVGGVENMELVKELYNSESYKAQQGAAIDQALAQINMAEGQVNENILDNLSGEMEDLNEENNEEVELTDGNENNEMMSILEEIKASTPIHGDKNARFTILEYSEFLCPYCKRQSDQGTINSVLEEYPTEVNAVFRNFIVHGAAAKLGEGIVCAGELGTEKEYFNLIEEAFAYEGNINVDSLLDIADKVGLNKKDMEKCIEEGRYTEEVNNQSSEGRQLFGVSGTPGNVIIDKNTGKFVLIPGAYPPEKFIEEIEKLKSGE
ncbi:MAG TPA: thioredoxin domain-containing protein [Candidatus Absconditabacterales bacterium]|nr:thioredoxin domain-containing protein [Candidatus Absconditabacterales bacterium]